MPKQLRAFLTDFTVIRPAHIQPQQYAIEWLAAAHAQAEKTARGGNFDVEHFQDQMKKFISRYGCGPDKIATRGHELLDFTHKRWADMAVFDVTEHPTGKGMDERGHCFAAATLAVFAKLYRDITVAPEDLIHVTCTGYASPSSAQLTVANKGWQKNTTVTHAYHMGCYASIPALRMASGFLGASLSSNGKIAGTKSRVDIVHTELCTLHLNPSLHAPEQLVVQSLFADGFIKYSLLAGDSQKSIDNGFEVVSLREEIVPDSANAMTWVCSDWGMRMSLAREVPALIAQALPEFLLGLFAQAGLELDLEKDCAIWAIHPGGPKIIDKVQELLGLVEPQVAHCKRVLFECGNMSSATLPHVWERMLADEQVPPGTLIVSLAFGPGLTICGSLLRKL